MFEDVALRGNQWQMKNDKWKMENVLGWFA
jgi:hypothetical protein